MANIKISELNELTQKENNDFLPIVDSSANETKKISVGNLTPSNDKLVHVGTSVDEDYRVNVLFSKELYNSATITNGIGISDTNGATYVDNNLFTTDYIDISGASDICWYGSANASGKGLWGAFYDSSKQYVSGITTTNNTFAVPDNAKYVRLSMRKTYTNSASIQKGTSIIIPSINVDNEEVYSKPVVLWQNQNMAQSFAGQTITLNDTLNNYSYYEVIYSEWQNNGNMFNSGKIPSNMKTKLYQPASVNYQRVITSASGNSMTFSSCTYYATYNNATGTTENDRIVPYQVIGYK
jgi:hypothetical protein